MRRDFAQALVVLAEALVSERRVLVIGDSSLGLHETASELGARVVHVYDPDGARALAQEPPTVRGTVLRGLPEGDFDVRDGAFDLAIVPDLGAIADAPALLARLRRVVGTDGAVMCAARSLDAETDGTHGGDRAVDYYELFDLVSLQFSNVRMVAAMALHGVTMAELGQDEIESAVRVDTQLAGERPPPGAFIALASQSDVALDAYAVIELPGFAAAPSDLAPQSSVAALAAARLRADVLESQMSELTAASSSNARVEQEMRRALDALEVERTRAARLEREIDELRGARAAAPPPRNTQIDEELAEQLAQTQLRTAALEEGVELAEKTIIVQRDRIVELEAALSSAEDARSAAPPPIENEEEILALENKLKERGEYVAKLEIEIARLGKLVRELVDRLEGGANDNGAERPDLEKKLDELALLAAHQRSELEARAWRIAQLENEKPVTS